MFIFRKTDKLALIMFVSVLALITQTAVAEIQSILLF